jgi:hypothetical protein
LPNEINSTDTSLEVPFSLKVAMNHKTKEYSSGDDDDEEVRHYYHQDEATIPPKTTT